MKTTVPAIVAMYYHQGSLCLHLQVLYSIHHKTPTFCLVASWNLLGKQKVSSLNLSGSLYQKARVGEGYAGADVEKFQPRTMCFLIKVTSSQFWHFKSFLVFGFAMSFWFILHFHRNLKKNEKKLHKKLLFRCFFEPGNLFT